MRNVSIGVPDIGLQHVVEDALGLLKGSLIEADRRKFVISDIKNLFEMASRGSELAEQRQLFVASQDISAYQNFSFVRMHVENLFNGKLRQLLSDVCTVFSLLDSNQPIPEEKKESAIRFLTIFLQRINRQGVSPGFEKVLERAT